MASSPITVSVHVLGIGTAILALRVVGTEGPPPVDLSARTWAALAAQGLLTTAPTTLLWNWGLTRVPASRAGVFLNREPLVGAILGVAIPGEVLGPLPIAGGGPILGAAYVFTSRDPGRA